MVLPSIVTIAGSVASCAGGNAEEASVVPVANPAQNASIASRSGADASTAGALDASAKASGAKSATDGGYADRPPSACVVTGTHTYLYSISVPIDGEDAPLVIGLYNGAARLDIPTAEGEETPVIVTAPIAFAGTLEYEQLNMSLEYRKSGQVHPVLKLTHGAPLAGVAVGDRLRARALFGTDLSVGPFDLPCSDVALADYNELDGKSFDEHLPAKLHGRVIPAATPGGNDGRIAAAPSSGVLRASWVGTPPLVRDTPVAVEPDAGDPADGLRIGPTMTGGFEIGTVDLDVFERRPGFVHARIRNAAGSVVSGWIDEHELYTGPSGHGEGICLCGCGSDPFPRDRVHTKLAPGAAISYRPGGPVWAHVPPQGPAVAVVVLAGESSDGWRQVTRIDHVAEGGGSCSSDAMTHAWVRAADVQENGARPAPVTNHDSPDQRQRRRALFTPH